MMFQVLLLSGYVTYVPLQYIGIGVAPQIFLPPFFSGGSSECLLRAVQYAPGCVLFARTVHFSGFNNVPRITWTGLLGSEVWPTLTPPARILINM